MERWIAERVLESSLCPSCRHIFKKFTVSTSETENEEISVNSIRRTDWAPFQFGPSYIPDLNPDHMPADREYLAYHSGTVEQQMRDYQMGFY